MSKPAKRDDQCDVLLCVLDAYHPGLRHKTAEGKFFGDTMPYSNEKNVEILKKVHRDIMTYGIDVGELMGMAPGELKKIVKGAKAAERPIQLPPWIVYDRRDGTADILPAGRPGTVIEKLPEGLAKTLARAANRWTP